RVHGRRPGDRVKYAAGILRQSAARADKVVPEPDLAALISFVGSAKRSVPPISIEFERWWARRMSAFAHPTILSPPSHLLERHVNLAALFQPCRHRQVLRAHEVRIEQL